MYCIFKNVHGHGSIGPVERFTLACLTLYIVVSGQGAPCKIQCITMGSSYQDLACSSPRTFEPYLRTYVGPSLSAPPSQGDRLDLGQVLLPDSPGVLCGEIVHDDKFITPHGTCSLALGRKRYNALGGATDHLGSLPFRVLKPTHIRVSSLQQFAKAFNILYYYIIMFLNFSSAAQRNVKGRLISNNSHFQSRRSGLYTRGIRVVTRS